MSEAAINTVNRVFRDFKRYTGDGLPGAPVGALLPTGDPSSGAHSPKKSELRTALIAVIEAPTADADRAEAAAAEVEAILADMGSLEDAVAAAEAAAASVSGLNATAIQGRLSLVSGVAVPTNDAAGQTSIYYMGVIGGYVPVWDGTLFVARSIATQLQHILDANSGHTGYHESGLNFDEFVAWDGTTLRLGSGPAWNAGAGSDNARGTGAGSTELELFQGVLVNKNTMTLRWGSGAGETINVPARRATFVGSFRATANGQASDTVTRRLLSNAYNQAPRPFNEVIDTTASWNYSVEAFRPSNNNAATKAELLFALAGGTIEAQLRTKVNSNGATYRTIAPAIYLDGSVASFEFASVNNSKYEIINVDLIAAVSEGLHTLAPYEYGGGADSQQWLGNMKRLTGVLFG